MEEVCKYILSNLYNKKSTIKFIKMNIQDLLFNPTKHHYVPPHRKLSVDEGKDVMENYNLKSKLQMPIILHTDRIAKWIGMKQGDIVEITRYNENSGKSYYYRCCI